MWQPATYGEIDDMIQAAESLMEPAVRIFWDRIGIVPQKWRLPPWGDEGGGFWVVALVGQQCVWYSDIEDGFNISRYAEIGRIGEYRCEQVELAPCIRSYFRFFTEAIASAA